MEAVQACAVVSLEESVGLPVLFASWAYQVLAVVVKAELTVVVLFGFASDLAGSYPVYFAAID
jgi:hypothetical protein